MTKEIIVAVYSIFSIIYGVYLINGVIATDQIGVQATALGVGILLLGLPILLIDKK